MGNEEMASEHKSDCLRRALQAALSYAGIQDELSWVPAGPVTVRDAYPLLQRLVTYYPWLTLYGKGVGGENDPVTLQNEPVFFAYDYDDGTDERAGHAVFMSDCLPMVRQLELNPSTAVRYTVTGWERRATYLNTEGEEQKRRHLRALQELVGENCSVVGVEYFHDWIVIACDKELGALRLSHFFRYASQVEMKPVQNSKHYRVQVSTERKKPNPFLVAEIIADARALRQTYKGYEGEWLGHSIERSAAQLLEFLLRGTQ